MRRPSYFVMLVLPLLLPLAAWTRYREHLTLRSESRVWIEGTSSITTWSCKADGVEADVEANDADATHQVLNRGKAVAAMTLVVPSEKIDCGTALLNDHLRTALKVSEFPTIAFRLGSYEVAECASGLTGTLKGTLTIGGVTRSVSIPAMGSSDAGSLRVVGHYVLDMTQYGITPPSLMLGRLKVDNAVTVQFDVVLKG